MSQKRKELSVEKEIRMKRRKKRRSKKGNGLMYSRTEKHPIEKEERIAESKKKERKFLNNKGKKKEI